MVRSWIREEGRKELAYVGWRRRQKTHAVVMQGRCIFKPLVVKAGEAQRWLGHVRMWRIDVQRRSCVGGQLRYRIDVRG